MTDLLEQKKARHVAPPIKMSSRRQLTHPSDTALTHKQTQTQYSHTNRLSFCFILVLLFHPTAWWGETQIKMVRGGC